MFDQLSAEILARLIKGFPRTTTTTTTQQNVDPAVYYGGILRILAGKKWSQNWDILMANGLAVLVVYENRF
jgi:hypothetical protein